MNHKRLKCALITGASLGLGKALACECAREGMSLVLVALPGDGLPELGASIAREHGVAVDWLEADLTVDATYDRLVGMIGEKDLAIDLLVNNAGIGSVGCFEDTDFDECEAVIRLNTTALVRLTRLLVPELKKRGGRVLNVASLGAFFPMPTLSVYSSTKSFVLNFSLALREELAGSVGVSVLCPNAFKTTAVVGDYVESLGLIARLACLAPEKIARIAIRGAESGRGIIIPGAFNRALAVAGRLVPRTLAMRAIRRFWGGFADRPEGSDA